MKVDRPIRAWKNVSDVEFVWWNNNDGSRKRLGGANEQAQTFTIPPPHQWPPLEVPGYYHIGYPLPQYPGYFENALEMLDGPGQWYLDRATGILHYWPRLGEDMTRADVGGAAGSEDLAGSGRHAERGRCGTCTSAAFTWSTSIGRCPPMGISRISVVWN